MLIIAVPVWRGQCSARLHSVNSLNGHTQLAVKYGSKYFREKLKNFRATKKALKTNGFQGFDGRDKRDRTADLLNAIVEVGGLNRAVCT